MRDKLKKYQERIELKIESDRQLAKELLKADKTDKAKLLLKKKKYYENNLSNTDQQLDNLDSLVNNIEYTMVEQQVVKGLKIGNDCLTKLHEMMSIDEIEDIMDDTKDAIEHQRQIDALISGQFKDEDIDEEINDELEALLAQELPELPEVPKEKLPEIIKEKKSKYFKIIVSLISLYF